MTKPQEEWIGSSKMTPEEFRALPQIQAFFHDMDKEKAAKDVYDAVVKDLMARVNNKAFRWHNEEERWAFLHIIEMAIRLAHNCAKSYEGVEGFRSMMERKFIAAFNNAIIHHPKFVERMVRRKIEADKRKAAANKRKRSSKAKAGNQ